MDSHVDSVIYRPVGSVGKLQGVQEGVCYGFQMGQHTALKGLHNNRCQSDRSVVIETINPRFLGNGDDGGCFKAGWNMACLQRDVEDVCEHWRQLISTVLQGGWRDRLWTGCFAGVLSFEDSINMSLHDGERRCCDG